MNVDILRERARIVRDIRRFFDERDFVEVETAVRIAAPAPEEHIDCPPVSTGGFLRASPELQMKKLLADGMDRIYQIGPCFREGEKGSRHNPEFTMIEWYRKDATYLDILADLEELFGRFGSFGRFGRWRVREAYEKYAGWDPWAEWDQDRFDFDMATKIEPAIKAAGGGIFLMDYPPQAASLAKLSDRNAANISVKCHVGRASSPCVIEESPFHLPGRGRPGHGLHGLKLAAGLSDCHQPSTFNLQPSTASYAERWEFYYDGMELANCFTELCDGPEQTRRFAAAREARRALGESDYPIDEEFLAKLPRIGSAAGVALGVDRLVMVLLGINDISAVRVG